MNITSSVAAFKKKPKNKKIGILKMWDNLNLKVIGDAVEIKLI